MHRILLISSLLSLWTTSGFSTTCQDLTYSTHGYSACTVDTRVEALEIFWRDEIGVPFGDMPTLSAWLANQGRILAFATNAGIFEVGTIPTGLLVAGRKELHAINRSDGGGNFFMKPNGVFWVSAGVAHVDGTERYWQLKPSPDLATQSGPLLVIGSKLREGINDIGNREYVRSGVCVRASGQTVFAISKGKVTMAEFGRFMLEGLRCADALYLDGCRSLLYSSSLGRSDIGTCKARDGSLLKAGPMIGVATTNVQAPLGGKK
jgi:uncharacterized protein YigE (DUF2233 family)